MRVTIDLLPSRPNDPRAVAVYTDGSLMGRYPTAEAAGHAIGQELADRYEKERDI